MVQGSLQQLVLEGRSGHQVISFPTDTVPALAVRPDCASLIFAVKQRRIDKPLILMAGTVPDIWSYVMGDEAERQCWQAVAERYWPGALTLVLPASDRVPPTMNPSNPRSIGVRVPDHPIAQAILMQTGPLATTSANVSGQPALQTLTEIAQQFPQVLVLALEELTGEQTPPASGQPSTVARWTGQGWEILRQGAIVLK